MARNRISTLLALMVLGISAIVVFVVGLFAYMSLTATPLHPDVNAVPSEARAAPPSHAAAAERARQAARAGLVEQNLPGLSAAVAVGGEIVWAEAFGYADLDSKAPVSPQTRFRTGEVSKALTSIAAGLLLDNGKLKLDDEIQVYVPDYPKKQWPVTLRQLMAHVAGLRDDQGDEAWMSPCEQTAEGLRLFADHSLLFEPGTKYHPSSYSWILVSAAIEAAANRPFFTFMRAQVFEPLGMGDTLPDAVEQDIPNRPTFYFPKFAGDNRYGPQLAREGDHSCFAGGGAFLSTPSDLVRFGSGVINGKLLKPETLKLLQTPLRLPSGEDTGYGLGWKLETVPLSGEQVPMAGHGTKEDFIGGSTYLMTFPDRRIVVAVMTNTSFADVKSVALQIAEAFAKPGSRPAAK